MENNGKPEDVQTNAPPVVIVQTPMPVAALPKPPVEIVATWRELQGGWRVFAMSEWIMRDRASFFEEIRARHDLTPNAQTASLMMAAVTVTAALALAFASITLFFWLTVPDYEFFVLLNVSVLAITAWWGLSFLRQGMRHVQQGA